jgi:hypothetical protein
MSYFIPEARKVVRKDFQELSPTKEVIAEMSTHLLCKRLQYILSVNRIHTRVFFCEPNSTISYDKSYDSHSSVAN